MKFSSLLAVTLAAVSVSARPVRRGVDPSLVLAFGVNPGTNPTGTGDCDGLNGIKIPCSCPPPFNDYLNSLNANVAAGHDVNNPGVGAPFPTDNSQQSHIIRLQTQISTLQNLFGSGKGCPAAATTWNPQLASLIAGNAPPAATQAPPPPAQAPPASAPPASAPPPASGGVDPALVVDFGVTAGTNPTGTGDCDGINGIKIPCTCPPSRDSYIQSLSANVAAGHDVNNPGIGASFPTDNSQQSHIIRLQTQISSLQNLFGPGKGCPAASTTWNSQLASLIAGNAPPAAAAPAPPAAPPATPAPPAPPASGSGVNAALVLDFGVQAGVNPTGTGDCDGLNGVKIPCTCPPPRDQYLASLNANVAAGHDVNNPGVGASFPTDGSINSQIIRLQTQISTMQNLFGSGKGCPAVATNWNPILAGLIAQPH